MYSFLSNCRSKVEPLAERDVVPSLTIYKGCKPQGSKNSKRSRRTQTKCSLRDSNSRLSFREVCILRLSPMLKFHPCLRPSSLSLVLSVLSVLIPSETVTHHPSFSLSLVLSQVVLLLDSLAQKPFGWPPGRTVIQPVQWLQI